MITLREPSLQRTCDNCQRCTRHCFGEPGCCMSLRRERCLTCSGAVVLIAGVDISRQRADDAGKTPPGSMVSKRPNARARAFAANPVPPGHRSRVMALEPIL